MIRKYSSLFKKLKFWKKLNQDSTEINLAGLVSIAAKTFFMAAIMEEIKKPILWVVSDPSQVFEVVSNFHIWQQIPIIGITKEMDESEIANLFSWVVRSKPSVCVVDIQTLNEKSFLNKEKFIKSCFKLEVNKKIKLVEFFDRLINFGYEADIGKLEREGTYLRRGGVVDIFPIGYENPVRIELFGDGIQSIQLFDFNTGKILEEVNNVLLYTAGIKGDKNILDYYSDSIVIADDLSDDETGIKLEAKHSFKLQPFLGEETFDCNFSAVLRYNSPLGFIADLKEKNKDGWKTVIFSKDKKMIEKFLRDNGVRWDKHCTILEKSKKRSDNYNHNTDSLGFEIFPEGFINHSLKLQLVTDREIFNIVQKSKKMEVEAAFLANLSINDYIVHFDHGIGIFRGVQKKKFNEITKEYLFIEYANSDKLFVPVDQADKVNKYIGSDGSSPRLTRLGSAEWETVVKRGREETLQIAEELLQIFAKRDQAKGYLCKTDNEIQMEFEKAFPYEPTDGQIEAVSEVKRDMESTRPMDRLICGDVGFGKTEVAMRAAFKAIQNGRQVAFLTPITILANQHYETLQRRMKGFGINIEMISRFRSKAEVAQVLTDLRSGKVDLVVGTHMLLQDKVEFKNLGLVIIDEEQRFGVKQKEKLKEFRVQIDILTLTATPIPRTLNMALAGIRDISTITTPPPGRLPIHTEVRRFGLNLIREVILRELKRDGQVYFLHNRVQTIESIADKLRILVPEAKFIVAHGQLASNELEKRILAFKEGKYNVLISSTIIENGIDLENANTLIVDQAETLGLAQAYQLRGRVGRSKRQAYAYFLYHSQRLRDDAKKRLRAIIEASELGSGFQIAMRDLEIRGAGEILGSRQHGTLNSIGVAHFCRLLSKAVEDLRLGKTKINAEDIIPDTKIELAISAYLPDEYIPKSLEKIRYYQRLSGVEANNDLLELKKEIEEKYGKLPKEAKNLTKIISLKILAKDRGVIIIREIDIKGKEHIEIYLGKKVTPKAIIGILSYNENWKIIESKMIIEKRYLGDKWFEEISSCVKHLQG